MYRAWKETGLYAADCIRSVYPCLEPPRQRNDAVSGTHVTSVYSLHLYDGTERRRYTFFFLSFLSFPRAENGENRRRHGRSADKLFSAPQSREESRGPGETSG